MSEGEFIQERLKEAETNVDKLIKKNIPKIEINDLLILACCNFGVTHI